jgi:hypothetical protein
VHTTLTQKNLMTRHHRQFEWDQRACCLIESATPKRAGCIVTDFRVIDGDGPGKEEREHEQERDWAKREFSWAIRDTAANMLRIIRGAGKPYELLLQMKKAIDSAIKFQELHNHWPFDVISSDLLIDDEMETILAKKRKWRD